MSAFPGKGQLTVHCAHTAYRLAECLEKRGAPVRVFQTWTLDETRQRLGEGDVMVLSGFWRHEYLHTAVPKLRFIQVCAAGYDRFDPAALAVAGVRLCNASGVNANAVADQAMALMLSLTRQLHLARDNQKAHHWRPMISEIAAREDELAGKTLLIVGMGTIGQRLAKRARAFDMRVIGVRRNTDAIAGLVDAAHTPAELPKLWGAADVVALTCPLTDETANIVDAEALAAMAPSSYLINVARGGCVDEAALISALENGAIAGAGIDTTAEEPLSASSALWDMANVVLTPHTAGETRAYEDNVVDILLENLERLWRGEDALRNQIV